MNPWIVPILVEPHEATSRAVDFFLNFDWKDEKQY